VFEVEIKAVCRACNTGWMHRLEMKVSKWIGPSLNDGLRTFPLDQHQREVLGTWATKTALMVELALRELRRPSFAPESHFRWLNEHADAPTPPPDCQVWMFGVSLAFGPGKWLQLASADSLWLGPAEPGVPLAYFSTFHAGLIGFQIFGPDVKRADPGQPPIVLPPLPVPPQVDPLLLQVWPAPRKPPIRWPPKPPKMVAEPAVIPTLAQWPLAVIRRPGPSLSIHGR